MIPEHIYFCQRNKYKWCILLNHVLSFVALDEVFNRKMNKVDTKLAKWKLKTKDH